MNPSTNDALIDKTHKINNSSSTLSENSRSQRQSNEKKEIDTVQYPFIEEIDHVHVNQTSQQTQLYTRRWLILFLFAMAELCNTVIYSVCNPIAIQVGEIYQQQATVVTLSATLYLFMHPVFTFPASYMILNKGVAASIKFGSFLTLVGVSIRCLVIYSGFYWILIGQILSGIGRPFILNAQANIAQNWFPLKQRTSLITLLNFIITLSGIFGQIIPSMFFLGYKVEDDNNDFTDGKLAFTKLLIFQSLFCFVFLVPLLFILRSRPPKPPSLLNLSTKKINFWESTKGIFSDLRFVMIFVSFSAFLGGFKGFAVCLAYLLNPFGYHSTAIAMFAVMPVFGGMISSIVAPRIYHKIGKYKPVIIGSQLFTITTFFVLYYACYIQSLPFLLFMAFVIGLFVIPVSPLLLEWGCKQIYPINDSFAIGVLYSGATLASSFIGELLTIVIDGNDGTPFTAFMGICFLNGLYIIAFLSVAFLRESKHRVFLQANHSFASKKPLNGDTINETNIDIFNTFPQACPEDDLRFHEDYVSNTFVLDSGELDQDQNVKSDEGLSAAKKKENQSNEHTTL